MSRIGEAGKAFWDTLLRAEQQLPKGVTPPPEIAKTMDLSTSANPFPGFGGWPQAGPVPKGVEQAMLEQGMITGGPYSPGRPIQQFSPWDMAPRHWELPTGFNVSTRPRAIQGRLSFWTLKNMLDVWDVSRLCIEHLEDDIRSFDWDILPARGIEEDVRDQCDKARAFLNKPDGQTPFDSWLNMFMEDVLRYDAGTIFRERNRAGDVKALEVISGTTIAPLVDFFGDVPEGEAPQQVQYVNGVPWVWLYEGDLIYIPYRLLPESPYGLPPIEWLMLTANTDVRFQWHFLNWFTEGTIPDTFMEAPPDSSDPEELAKFQATWDAVMEGNQAMKHKVRWIPAGSKPTKASEKTFDVNFPLYLMRKTCAAYKVTPADIGITDQVNKASSETQVDVQFRIGTAPRLKYIENILTMVLQEDLKLPVRFNFDVGREKQDRLQEAQAMDAYVKMGALSPDEVRQDILNKDIDSTYPTPRFIFSARAGAIPLKSIAEIAGKIDPRTASYEPSDVDITAIDKVRQSISATGVIPQGDDLASKKQALVQPPTAAGGAGGAAPPGTGSLPPPPSGGGKQVASASGEQSAKGVGAAPAKRSVNDELKAWRENSMRRVKEGKPPKRFESDVIPDFLHRAVWSKLNRAASAQEVADAFRLPLSGLVISDPLAAGLAVKAADSGRVLMIQRARDPEDDAAGKWEFPGGHLEEDELPLEAAKREWQEETGCKLPDGQVVGSWLSSDGVYECFVYKISSEDLVPNNPDPENRHVLNPDDPDHDNVEVFAWFDPKELPNNPSMRDELQTTDWSELERDQLKARHPQIKQLLEAEKYYAPKIRAALKFDSKEVAKSGALPKLDTDQLAKIFKSLLADGYFVGYKGAEEHLSKIKRADTPAPEDLGSAVMNFSWDDWSPGNDEAAALLSDSGLQDLLDEAGVTIKGITDTTLQEISDTLEQMAEQGASVDQIASALAEIVGDDRAYLIATTELARAVGAATEDSYQANGVGQFNWMVTDDDKLCPLCQDQGENGPYEVGIDDMPPLHPQCRCATTAVVGSISMDNVTSEDQSE